jgi:hypothetical protein
MVAILYATLCGAVLGFLFYNFNPATIFLGDTGSLFLGYILGTAALLSGRQKEGALVSLLVPVLALGLPLTDTLLAMVRRFLEKRSIFSPDRGHIHHRLLDLGVTHRRAVLIEGASASAKATRPPTPRPPGSERDKVPESRGMFELPVTPLTRSDLAPLLVALATLVARRWGPKIGGIVIGLPLSTGPIFLFLAIDQGLDFAARACVGILFGLVGLAGFALVYTAVSRHAGWAVSLMVSAVAYFVVSGAVNSLAPNGVIGAGLAAYAALLLVASLIKRPQAGATKPASLWWDIWFRVITAAALTLAITTAAARLGPTFSGIVGTYPVVTTVIMTFTHHQFGREVAIAMLRGTVLSWISL